METTLLATKLFIPPVRPGLVARPRLLEKLWAVVNNSLVLISAPAGSGKTTLLSQWVQNSRVPTTWLSLGESENDPRTFWEYFIAAAKAVHPAAGETSLSMLRSGEPVPIESILTTLMNELTAVPEDFVLVLDDYHCVQSPPVHRGLTFFLEHLPYTMHVVIATRADPPLPLPRFRGKANLLEIGADDLRFTTEEAAGCSPRFKARLPADDLNAVNAHDGWLGSRTENGCPVYVRREGHQASGEIFHRQPATHQGLSDRRGPAAAAG